MTELLLSFIALGWEETMTEYTFGDDGRNFVGTTRHDSSRFISDLFFPKASVLWLHFPPALPTQFGVRPALRAVMEDVNIPAK